MPYDGPTNEEFEAMSEEEKEVLRNQYKSQIDTLMHQFVFASLFNFSEEIRKIREKAYPLKKFSGNAMVPGYNPDGTLPN
jgi:DNA modification methylase